MCTFIKKGFLLYPVDLELSQSLYKLYKFGSQLLLCPMNYLNQILGRGSTMELNLFMNLFDAQLVRESSFNDQAIF